MRHILDKDILALVSLADKLVGMLQLFITLFHLIVDLMQLRHIGIQRLLHPHEAILQLSDSINTLAIGQRLLRTVLAFLLFLSELSACHIPC